MENIKKILISETKKPRVLIFAKWHHLVDMHQVSSNCAPGTKNATPQGQVLYRYNYKIEKT